MNTVNWMLKKIVNDKNVDKNFREKYEPATPEHNVCKYCNYFYNGHCYLQKKDITDLTGCVGFENDVIDDERDAIAFQEAQDMRAEMNHERNLTDELANEHAGR